VRQTSTGNFLSLEPQVSENLMDRLALGLDDLNIAHKDMVILASIDIRRYIKKFVEPQFRELDVISFGEVTDTVSINVLKTL
jgi:type III secretion protein V